MPQRIHPFQTHTQKAHRTALPRFVLMVCALLLLAMSLCPALASGGLTLESDGAGMVPLASCPKVWLAPAPVFENLGDGNYRVLSPVELLSFDASADLSLASFSADVSVFRSRSGPAMEYEYRLEETQAFQAYISEWGIIPVSESGDIALFATDFDAAVAALALPDVLSGQYSLVITATCFADALPEVLLESARAEAMRIQGHVAAGSLPSFWTDGLYSRVSFPPLLPSTKGLLLQPEGWIIERVSISIDYGSTLIAYVPFEGHSARVMIYNFLSTTQGLAQKALANGTPYAYEISADQPTAYFPMGGESDGFFAISANLGETPFQALLERVYPLVTVP